MIRHALFAGLLVLVGCAGETQPSDATSSDLTASAAQTASFVTKIKAAYAKSVTTSSPTVFAGEVDVDPAELRADAATAYAEYEATTNAGLISSGPPAAKKALVDGRVVYLVSGDVSDTGSEFGFYDARGKRLALAYSGQGMHADATGVDWMY